MKLSIITLTYNNLKYTKKYIDSLYKYTNDFELIIIDNGSTDGTIEYIKTLSYENIKTIFNSENLGFAKGNNQGIEIAEGEYIGFLNNDILLYPNWFEKCENIFQKENAAFVSPRHINPHYDNTNEYNYIDYFKKNFQYKNEYEKSFDECVFSCVITKKDLINKIGKFDEKYHLAFFEDNDYKYRAIQSGFDVYVCNTVCFFHFGSITSFALNQEQENNRKRYYSSYRFAEYLSITGAEKYQCQRMIKQYQVFPLKQIYGIYLFFIKIKNRIKKGL